MEKENARENGAKIYCVYFHNKEETYDFGEMQGKSLEILDEISKLGGTNKVYQSDSLKSFCDAFKKINEAIENNSRLKLKK
jgi:hypothetical protein